MRDGILGPFVVEEGLMLELTVRTKKCVNITNVMCHVC